ncbi:MAG: SCO1664 family protein [Chloroflexota bacterium]
MSKKKKKKEAVEVFSPPSDTPTEAIVEAITQGELDLHGLMPWSSNYTFLCTLTHNDLCFSAVYKPGQGERPLWDFDSGTLCNREAASYVVSSHIGDWALVPPTILRDGPHGVGSVQQFIMTDYEVHYFTIQDDPTYQTQFQQLALLDYVINNADRKGGHCLLGENDKIWAIDNGLSFHTEYKLRTVIWDYADQGIPGELYADLKAFDADFAPGSSCYDQLEALLTPREIDYFCQRLKKLLKSGRFPEPYGMRDYPYPPV